MKLPHNLLSLHSNQLEFEFIPTGDVFEMKSGSFLINQFRGNAKDGSANNIYLRRYEGNVIKDVYPLLGQQSQSRISYQNNGIRFSGSCNEIDYMIDLFLVANSWFYEITLESTSEVTVDLLYGQDIGLSGKENVLTNELYISQYLGHSIFEGEYGHVICSRQNMADSDCNPYLQQGSMFHKVAHFSTDGLDFFGLDYKVSNLPHALYQGLTDRNLQYEFAYSALLTETFTFSGSDTTVFYGHFKHHHPDKIATLEFQNEIKEHYAQKPNLNDDFAPVHPFTIKQEFQSPWNSVAMEKEEINSLFPVQKLAENDASNLLSFFTPDHAHVVTRCKEEQVLRPHGTIIMTPPDLTSISDSLISSTHYMFGIFNSHIVLGNTNMHKFISTPRGFLNIHKNSGQRIYVKVDNTYHLLALPALFEMGMNYSRWFYKIADDTLIVTSYSNAIGTDLKNNAKQPAQIHLVATSEKGKKYDFIVTNQLSLAVNEYSHDIEGTVMENGMHFAFPTDKYSNLSYDIVALQPCQMSDDRIFYEENTPFDETLLTFSFEATSEVQMIIKGSYDDASIISTTNTFEEEKKHALDQYASILKRFQLDGSEGNTQLSILNETAWWYTHNAMIHFCMPHGLEQPGGAAWGTRDICQGPIEYFLATGNTSIVHDILVNIFAHQEDETKEWPQWFMFDRYEMNAGECHGDVIFWPLKSVADYLTASNDYAILEEIIPYADKPDKKESLFAHIQAAVSQIQSTRFISDTGLITYAGGDWDDTLQPAQPEMREKLVSVWTQALAYQTFHLLGDALKSYDSAFALTLNDLAITTKFAFSNYAIKDDVIAGFLEWDKSVEYLLHPSDTQTGIHYRLLPQTRSIIAELVDKPQAAQNISVIHTQLDCPDGVRLMDAPASYDGGISHLFKRAEQAANIGREISLQYTHAHIRYIEAMAKYGNAAEAWNGLFRINPILIQQSVQNAKLRQSNMYFSSSDGDYLDRYEYQKHFSLLRTGHIPVKGGWRLYSSGPGIYMHQLISHILGIRFEADNLVIDPILPDTMENFDFQLECFGELCHFHYQKSDSKTTQLLHNGQPLTSTACENSYRNAGIKLSKDELLGCNTKEFTILY